MQDQNTKPPFPPDDAPPTGGNSSPPTPANTPISSVQEKTPISPQSAPVPTTSLNTPLPEKQPAPSGDSPVFPVSSLAEVKPEPLTVSISEPAPPPLPVDDIIRNDSVSEPLAVAETATPTSVSTSVEPARFATVSEPVSLQTSNDSLPPSSGFQATPPSAPAPPAFASVLTSDAQVPLTSQMQAPLTPKEQAMLTPQAQDSLTAKPQAPLIPDPQIPPALQAYDTNRTAVQQAPTTEVKDIPLVETKPVVPETPVSVPPPAPVAQAVLSVPHVQPAQVPVSAVVPPSPSLPPVSVPASEVAAHFTKKSKFPKILLFVALGIFLISLIGYLIVRFMGNNGTPVSTSGEILWWGVELPESAVAPLIAEYEESHSGVNVTYVKQSPQEYRERLTNALAKGEGPDIFEIHNSWVPMFKNELSAMPSTVMGKEEYKATFYPVMETDLTTARGLVGIPLFYDAITLYINEDIFSSSLRTPPKTWIEVQDLADSSRGLTQKDPEGRVIQSGIALGTTENIDYWPEVLGLMMYQNKAKFTDLSSPTTKDVFTFYQSFTKTLGSWNSTLPRSTIAFARQKTAMIFAPARAAGDIIKENSTLQFKTVPLPQLPKENPSDPDFSYATYWAEAVWERSKGKQTAWEFLKFMSSQESLQKINQTLKASSSLPRVYPRPPMNQEFLNDPILGSVVSLAPSAKSWYLADKTDDGATGINTLLMKAFATGLGGDEAVAQTEITKILTQYGVIPK
jgi:ABC-type glycerol-3-phosphate transport system substrate-binding protein